MAARFAAEQNLKNDPRAEAISDFRRRFPVGRAAQAWQIADQVE
jgi:hypothetical protein